jgi:hypothetical protein
MTGAEDQETPYFSRAKLASGEGWRMTGFFDEVPLPTRLFSVVPGHSGTPQQDPSEPIVLALLVADALDKAKLGRAVLEMRESPVDWVRFLVELDSLLREDHQQS